jgi:hypothetical protein
LAAGVASCFSDEGNYDYRELPDFYVDTTGVDTRIILTQFDALSLPSRLVYAGDKADLDFSWTIYSSGGGQSSVLADTLARTENLSTTITVTPGNYRIEFRAFEPLSGIRAAMLYDLTVENAVGTGLLVFYQRDGQADCDIIKSPLFIYSLAETSIARGVYSKANPTRPLTGEPLCVGMMHASTSISYINLLTESDAVRISSTDMTIMSDFHGGMFLTTPETCKPQGYFSILNSSSGTAYNAVEILVNDGKIYSTLVNMSGGFPQFASAKILMGGLPYVASPHSIMGYSLSVMCYDEVGKRFLHGNMYSSELMTISTAGKFDMNNVGKEVLYMDQGFINISSGMYGYAVMEGNPGERAVHVFSTGNYPTNCSGVAVLDLSGNAEITGARYYAFGMRGPVIYYATGERVYRVNHDLDASTVTPSSLEWSAPAGEEITCVRVFRGRGTGFPADENLDCKYLLVATYDGAEGRVYVLPADIVSGALEGPAEIHRQFGKIKDLRFKLY